MKRLLIALSLLLCAAVAAPAIAQKGKDKSKGKANAPEVIQLPVGFGPEGITTTKRHTFVVSSRESGAIYKGSLRTREGDILVPGFEDGAATGIKVDKRKRLFVSGADSGVIRVYDVRDGALLHEVEVAGAGFINDVILTKRAAYFTDSAHPVLYKLPIARNGDLGALVPVPLGGEWEQEDGQFNANGIEAARGGRTLIVVNSFTGKLFTVDAATGLASEIDLGGENVQRGDGILLKGRKLYVVQNTLNLVTPVKLSRNLSEGDVRDSITSGEFNVPTTIARSRGRLYVVNAKFGSNSPQQTYEVVKVPKR
jgi:sugar lactone lactonase YvrE